MKALILLVDDNPANLKLASVVLEGAGYDVERARDAQEALAALGRIQPDLILMDLALPGMDGLTLTRRLRQTEKLKDIPIVALTAHAMKGDEQRVLAAGCNGYIAKPIDTRRLPEQVAGYLGSPVSTPRNILIVEDNDSNRKLLRVVLQAEGLNVIEAPDGAVALELLDRHPVDAIITDILMPDMDGYRLCWELRTREQFRDLPIIVYTNTYTSAGDEKLALEMGADRYLAKPSPVSVLIDALRETAGIGVRAPRQAERPKDLELMKSYSERLVAKIEERNLELAVRLEELQRLQQQVLQSQKLEVIGRMAAGIAHDFNNLLTVILGYCSMAQFKVGPASPATPDLERIRTASEHAAALTRRLLAFGRRQILQPVILDLNTAVREMEGLLARVLGGHVSIRVALDPQGCHTRADAGQVEQVILNLALNARDAMKSGGEVLIRTERVTVDAAHPARATVGPGDYVELSVRDTGAGITPEVMEHLFEPFFTTKVEGEGTGLGLATVMEIVRQMGGDITLQTTPGVETVFRVLLPRLEPQSVSTGESVPAPPAKGGEKILLVEDDTGLCRLVRDALVDAGYRVHSAESPDEATRALEAPSAVFDLLLADLVLPGTNGIELARQARLARSGLKVLFMSGYSPGQAVQGQLGQAGTRLLPKPFDLATLLGTVREVLDS